jgi:hypothetical protein
VSSPDGRILTASKDNTVIDRVKVDVPRCLTPAQRQRLLLAPTPPS